MRALDEAFRRAGIGGPSATPLGSFVADTLAGVAQVLFQPSPAAGALLVVAMLINSPGLTGFALVGALSGTLWARVRRYDPGRAADGLFGFNGALVGLALGSFYALEPLLLLPTVAGGIATAVIVERALRSGLIPLTGPFVAVTWTTLILLTAGGYPMAAPASAAAPPTILVFDGLVMGIGHILFQQAMASALIATAVLLVSNPLQGVGALCAAAFAVGYGWLFDVSPSAVNLGVLGFNAALCAIFLAGTTAVAILSVALAVISATVLSSLFISVGWPPLAFPFVVSTWLVLWGRRRLVSA